MSDLLNKLSVKARLSFNGHSTSNSFSVAIVCLQPFSPKFVSLSYFYQVLSTS